MAEDRMLNFLGALVGAEWGLAPPTVVPVRFQVRTGASVPPKIQMRKAKYEIMIWKYRVDDFKAFANFLAEWEATFSNEYNVIDDPDPANMVISQSYLGTFPARSPAGAAINRFNTAWGGKHERLMIVDRCRVALTSQLSPDDEWLASELGKLLKHVSGDVEVEILDPSIGF